MGFDLQNYISELRESEEKKTIVGKYEVNYGLIVGDIYDQKWYKDYVSKFAPIKYTVPNLFKDDFDWDLLVVLVASSFSSECRLKLDENIIELRISVENDGKWITKSVNELYPFQINRLYQIYVEEQLNLQNHFFENEEEKLEIIEQRKHKLLSWSIILEERKRIDVLIETTNELKKLNLF